MGIYSRIFHLVALLDATDTRLYWNLEVLVFVEGGKPENPEKNPWSKDKNQQQTQIGFDSGPVPYVGHIGGR